MYRKRLSIVVKDQVAALHSWPDCNIREVLYLKHPHRHVFHVTLKIEVFHSDREKEFHVVKGQLTKWLRENYEGRHLVGVSCEMMCRAIYDYFSSHYKGVLFVSVYEDGENGAELELVPSAGVHYTGDSR